MNDIQQSKNCKILESPVCDLSGKNNMILFHTAVRNLEILVIINVVQRNTVSLTAMTLADVNTL